MEYSYYRDGDDDMVRLEGDPFDADSKAERYYPNEDGWGPATPGDVPVNFKVNWSGDYFPMSETEVDEQISRMRARLAAIAQRTREDENVSAAPVGAPAPALEPFEFRFGETSYIRHQRADGADDCVPASSDGDVSDQNIIESPPAMQEALDRARVLFARATAKAPRIKQTLRDVCEQCGGTMEHEFTDAGQPTAAKSMSSTFRKVQLEMIERHLPAQAIELNDSVRFTVAFPDDDYHQGSLQLREELRALGFEQIKPLPPDEGGWLSRGWRGLNFAFRDPDGLQIQLHVHTYPSLAAALTNRDLYEAMRTPARLLWSHNGLIHPQAGEPGTTVPASDPPARYFADQLTYRTYDLVRIQADDFAGTQQLLDLPLDIFTGSSEWNPCYGPRSDKHFDVFFKGDYSEISEYDAQIAMIDIGTDWPRDRFPRTPGRADRLDYGSALRGILAGLLDHCPEDLGFSPHAVEAYNAVARAIAAGHAEPDLDLVRAAVAASVDHLRELDRAEDAADDSPMANIDLGKGVWHAADSTGYIALDLTDDIPDPAKRTVEGIELSPKTERHCSLVDIRDYVGDRDDEQSIVEAVKNYLQEHDLRFTGLGDERYLCRKDDRVTIIAPVRIEGIDEFFGFVQTLIDGYEPPFLHVTLLKNATTKHGISVNSARDLAQYCEKLTG
jgi:hypothetical protein